MINPRWLEVPWGNRKMCAATAYFRRDRTQPPPTTTIETLNYYTPPLSCRGQITLSNIDEICPLAIPNQISLISMHVPSLIKIPWHLHNLSSGNRKGVSRADNSVKILRNLPVSNRKPDLYNINAHTKFGENPLMFTQIIIRKRNTDRRTDVRLTDVQRETIMPRHYHVAGITTPWNST